MTSVGGWNECTSGRGLFTGLSVATVLKATQPVKTNKHIVHLSTLKGTDEDEEVLHIAIEDPERTGVHSYIQKRGISKKIRHNGYWMAFRAAILEHHLDV